MSDSISCHPIRAASRAGQPPAFAVNYSLDAARLVAEGAIEIDVFKCPEIPEAYLHALTFRPCYLHFRFRAGRRQMGGVDWTEVQSGLDATGTPFMNMHLAPCTEDFPGMALASSSAEDRRRLIEAMRADIAELTGRFGAERVILENVMWDPEPPWRIPEAALDAGIIAALVRESGAGLVLDLAHAQCSARHFGCDVREYVERLPLEHLRELHVSGTRLDTSGVWADHYPMGGHDWDLLEWAASRIRGAHWPTPHIVAFEYGGTLPDVPEKRAWQILREQAPLARRLVRSFVGTP